MLVPSPTQAVAVRDWLLAVLNTDDEGAPIVPALFATDQVFIGERDHPRSSRFARIGTIAIVGRGLARSHEVEDVGGPGQVLRERRAEHREWVTSITVATSLSRTDPQLGETAGVMLQRAVGATEGVATSAMLAQGVAFARRQDIQDVARLTGSQQWETRSSVTLTWLCGWTAVTPTDWLESASGEGTVNGLAPLPFDSRTAGP